MKFTRRFFSLLTLLTISSLKTNAQTVDASPETQNICFGASANLTATYSGPVVTSTTSYAVSTVPYAPDPLTAGTAVALTDDSQSGLLPIGFNFCFFGQTYTQFIIGSNNWIGFSTGQTSTWVTTAIPNNTGAAPRNTIMGAWQDINPGVGGTVKYQVYGVAPNRRLSVSWNNVPMFSCTGQLYSSQITIFETSNIIETRIVNKSLCASWNSGNAVHGLHDVTGTIAVVVPGRNNTQWTATNECTRFTPNGPATSTVNWYILPSNTLVGTGTAITVTPPACQVTTSYYAQVSSAGTCVSGFGTDTIQVIQTNCTPCSLTLGNNGPLCAGSTLNLTASTVTGATYAWTGPNGFTSTLQNPTITGVSTLASGTYTCVATQASSCNSCTATTTVVVNPIPAAPTPTNDGPICSGNTLNLSTPAVAGATYSWTGPAGFSSSLQNPSVPAVTAVNGGNYSVTVTVNGCTSPAGVTTVVVKNTPSAPVATSNSPLCAGSNLILGANNIAGATYSWTGPAGFTSAVRNPPPFAAGVSAAGTYSVTVTVGGCTSLPGTVTVVVNPIPAAPTVTPISICYNTSGTLTATVSGATYEWYDAATGGTLLGTGTTYTTPALTSSTTYYVHSNTAGCIGPMTAVPVTVAANFSVDAGLDDSICSGGTTTLNAVSPIGAGFTYTWNPGALSGPSVTVTPSSTTTYTLTVFDPIGCNGSDSVIVNVGSPLLVSTTGLPASCFGSCNGTGSSTISGSFAPYTYQWSNGISTSTISGLCAGTYTLIATDVIGCTNSDTIQIQQPTAISLSISALTSHCNQPDGSATVVATGGVSGYTYLWSNGQTTSTATNLVPGSYCVTVTDANGCYDSVCVTVPNTPGVMASVTAATRPTCFGLCDGSATVTASAGIAPYTFLWNNGQTTATAIGLCAGSYTCTVTDASGCTDTALITLTQPAAVNIDAMPAVTICIGQSTNLTATAIGGNPGGYTFNWNSPAYTGNPYTVSPTSTTTYSVTATDGMGCVSATAQTVTVTVRPPLSVTASNGVSICPGASTNLSAVGSGGDNTYSYSWMPGAGSAAGFTVSPSSTTTYTVVLTDGCTTLPAVDSVTVTVLPLPTVNFSSNLNSGCTPLCVQFTDQTTVVGGTASSWNWNFGGAGASNVQNPLFCFETQGVYGVTLTVTTSSGCVNTYTIPDMITVNALPTADFSFDPNPASIAAPNISFHDLSTNASSYLWNFGDPGSPNNTSALSNPYHFYSDTGTFCATLVVMNTTSCADTATYCLVINPEFTFYIPNAFTPGSNGLNDTFAPKGEYLGEYSMRIFDRWGNLCFFTNDIHNGWDGRVKSNGEIAQEDVYVYIIEVRDRVGELHQYIGHVTIVK